MADENAEPNCCRLETVLVRRRPPRAGREHPRVPPAPTRVLGHDALQETIKSHGTLPTDEVLRGAPAEELVRMMDCEALQGQYLALLLAAAFGEPTLGHACSGRLGPRRTGIDSLPLRRARASLLSVCVCVPSSRNAGETADASHYAERLAAVARTLVRLLERSALPDKMAKSCADWLALEVRARARGRHCPSAHPLIRTRWPAPNRRVRAANTRLSARLHPSHSSTTLAPSSSSS